MNYDYSERAFVLKRNLPVKSEIVRSGQRVTEIDRLAGHDSGQGWKHTHCLVANVLQVDQNGVIIFC
jgi:hypothetical protein